MSGEITVQAIDQLLAGSTAALSAIEAQVAGEGYAAKIPVLGPQLLALYNSASPTVRDALTTVTQLRDAINSALQTIRNTADLAHMTTQQVQSVLQSQLTSALHTYHLDSVGVPTPTVQVGSDGSIGITLAAAHDDTLTFDAGDLGMSALDFTLDGTVSATTHAAASVSFGLDTGGFYVDGDNTHVSLAANGSLGTLTANGDLGFLTFDASNIQDGFENAAGQSVSSGGDTLALQLDATLAGGRLRDFSGDILNVHRGRQRRSRRSPRRQRDVPPAAVDLGRSARRFHLLRRAAERRDQCRLGRVQVGIDHVKYDLGNFFDQFIKPVLDRVLPLLEPINAILDTINFDITAFVPPELRATFDLAGHADGTPDGKITLIDLLAMTGTDTRGLVSFLDTAQTLVNLANTLTGSQFHTGFTVDVGSYLTVLHDIDSTVDTLRSIPLDAGSVVPAAGDIAALLNDIAHGVQGNGLAEDPAQGQAIAFSLGALLNSSVFSIPILQHPADALKLLLGQTVDLVKFDMAPIVLGQEFAADGTPLQVIPLVSAPVWFFPPITLNIGVAFQAVIDLSFGLDSSGLSQWAAGGFDPAHASDILKGLYLDDQIINGVDTPEIALRAALSITGTLEAGIGRLSGGGNISGELLLDLNDALTDAQHRIYLDQAIADPFSLLTIQGGQISAGFSAQAELGVGPLRGVVWHYTSPRLILVDVTADAAASNPDAPLPGLGEMDGSTLLLNIGDRAGSRAIAQATDTAEQLDLGAGLSNGVKVSGFGVGQRFPGAGGIAVTLISGDGGAGDDGLYLAPTLAVAARLSGGAGDDNLIGGAGSDLLDGGSDDDSLQGNAGADRLTGGTGNDVLEGGAGADAIDGGAGYDLASYANAAAAVTINLTTGALAGDAAGDTFTGIEAYEGSRFNDALTGGAQADMFSAGAGNDNVRGLAGNDILSGGTGTNTIDGGADYDLVSYLSSPVAITISMSGPSGTASGGAGTANATSDTLTGIEELVGSQLNDIMTGGAGTQVFQGARGADRLDGGADNDILVGGDGGDTLIGGAGEDTANYFSAPTGVTANLATGGTGGDAAGDTYATIEDLSGSTFADDLTGDGNANYLNGAAGNDALHGAAGNDVLEGGGGQDSVYGDAGTDTLRIDWSTASAAIGNSSGPVDDAGGGYAGGLTNGTDSIAFASIENFAITAGSGDDSIVTRGGNDTINLGAGNDMLDVGAGADTADGASGYNGISADLTDATGAVIWDVTTNGFAAAGNLDRFTNFAYFGTIVTGSGADRIVSSRLAANGVAPADRDETLRAGGGDDSFTVYNGNDSYYGNAGTDTLVIDWSGRNAAIGNASGPFDDADGGFAGGFTNGTDTVSFASVERFTITGGAADDSIVTANGNDIVRLGGGNDFVDLRSGADNADGGTGYNGISIDMTDATGAVSLNFATNSFAAAGNLDRLANFAYFGTITTAAGADTIVSSKFAADGVARADRNETLNAGNGADSFTTFNGADTFNAGAGADTLVIDWAASTSAAGNSSGPFDDALGGTTGAFADGTRSIGYSSVETFRITTGTGNDTIITAGGNDVVALGTGDDFLDAKTGTDTADGGAGYDGISADLTDAAGAINWDVTANTFSGGPDAFTNFDYFGTIVTAAGNDVIISSRALANGAIAGKNETVRTAGGNDSFTTFNGADTYDAGTGSDTLIVDWSASTTNAATSSGPFADGAGGFTGAFADGIRSIGYSSVETFRITTGSGSDNIITAAGNDNIATGIGNDVVSAGDGNDTVSLGTGDDFVDTGKGTDTADGGGGFDGISADLSDAAGAIKWDVTKNSFSGGPDVFSNFEYFGTILTAAGADTLVSSRYAADGTSPAARNESATTGAGDDTFTTYNGNDTFNAGPGNDILIIAWGDLTTGAALSSGFFTGSDGSGYAGTYSAGTGATARSIAFDSVENFKITTGSGNDTIYTGTGSDTVAAGAGDDYVNVASGADTADGGDGYDAIDADLSLATTAVAWNFATNTFSGGGDTVSNFEYFTTLSTGRGNDAIVSSKLAADGTAANRNETLTSGDGNDSFTSYNGNDTFYAGAGTDTLILDWSAKTTSVVNGGPLYSAAQGGYNSAFSDGTQTIAFDSVEKFTLTSGSGNDNLTTGDGDDVVKTGAGNDMVNVGLGRDTADGGAGYDGITADLTDATGAIAWDLTANIFSGGPDSFTNFEYFGTITTAAGADTITSSRLAADGTAANRDEIVNTGNGNDSFTSFNGNDTFNAGAGIDTLILDWSAKTTSVVNGGPLYSAALGGYNSGYNDGTQAIAFDSVEKFVLTTGSANDNITTGDNDDVVKTGGGDDIVNVGLGRDAADGGTGYDGISADLTDATGAVTWNLTTNAFSGGPDSFTNFEYFGTITTAAGADTIISSKFAANGTAPANRDEIVNTGNGDDSFTTYNGSDTFNAGSGTDTLIIDWSAKTTAVVNGGPLYSASLGGYNSGYNDGTQAIAFDSVEKFVITTGTGADNVTTGDNDDVVKTGDGNDVVNVGLGHDTADGGAGYDGISADLTDATGAVTWNLTTNAFSGGPDSFTNFEYFGTITTAAGADTIVSSKFAANGTAPANREEIVNTGNGDDSFTTYNGNDTFNAGSGTDTLIIDWSAKTTSVVNGGPLYSASLGGYSSGFNDGTQTIAFDSVETFTINSGSGNDNITTGTGNDSVRTGTGNDMVDVGTGSDVADGGAGYDGISADLSEATGAVQWNVATNTFTAAGTADSFANFEYFGTVTTGAGSDTLTSSRLALNGTSPAGKNEIANTGAGNDSFTTFNGSDTFNAGDGIDTLIVDYSASNAAVTNGGPLYASALGGYGSSFSDGAQVIGYDSVEKFVILGGSATDTITTGDYDDTVSLGIGNDTANTGGGNDLIDGGAGRDTINAGFGTDTVSYASDPAAVNVNLATGVATDGGGARDMLSDVENVVGSRFADTLVGSAAANDLNGGAGADTMAGGRGADRYTVDDAGDVVTEATGSGYDTVAEALANYTLGANLERLTLLSNAGASGTGNELANRIDGAGGGDMLAGRAGRDTLVGGAGADTLAGGADGDLLIGGVLGTELVINGGFETQDGINDSNSFIRSSPSDFNGVAYREGGFALFGWSSRNGAAFALDTDGINATFNTGDGHVAFDMTAAAGANQDLYQDVAGLAAGQTLLLSFTAALPSGHAGDDGVLQVLWNNLVVGTVPPTSLEAQSYTFLVTAAAGANRLEFREAGNAGDARGTSLDAVSLRAVQDDGANDTAVFTGAWRDYDISAGNGVYTVTDRRAGAPDGTDTLAGVDQFTFTGGTVAAGAALNVGPIAQADSAALVEKGLSEPGTGTATGSVLANDTDANLATAALGETLSVVAIRTGTPAAGGAQTAVSGSTTLGGTYGTLTINPDGSYSYVLDDTRAATNQLRPGQQASDVFTYTVADAHNAQSSAAVSFVITGSSDLAAVADSLYLTYRTPSSLDVAALLGNDRTSTGEALSVTGFASVVGGSVTLADGRLIVTGTSTSGSFDYIVTSASGENATGHATFTAPAVRGTVTVPGGYTAADLVGGARAVHFSGSAGADRLIGGAGNDRLDGKAGNDAMAGGAGNDFYYVDSRGDTIAEAAGQGTDTVVTTLASYTLGAALENLQLIGAGDVAATGNAANNVITTNNGNGALVGLGGDDRLIAGTGNDLIDGGDGSDTLVFVASRNPLTVDLRITGAQATGAGMDTLIGIENVTTSGGDDIVYGNGADNMLIGGPGRDTLFGGDGNDILDGGIGNDAMTGGAGDDTYIVDSTRDTVTELPGAGNDSVRTTLASYTLGAEVENLVYRGADAFQGIGNALANRISGGDQADTLSGLGGDDTLTGGGGDDTITGGDGADRIVGSQGGDVMTGGAGRDLFVFTALDDFGTIVLDRVTDFSRADVDRISLQAIDTDPAAAGDQGFTWIGTNAFTTAAHATAELRIEAAVNGDFLVQGDVDRDGVADFSFLVHATALAATDFQL